MSYYNTTTNDQDMQSFNGNNSILLDRLWITIWNEINDMEQPRTMHYFIYIRILGCLVFGYMHDIFSLNVYLFPYITLFTIL